jgi:hypothetical protein
LQTIFIGEGNPFFKIVGDFVLYFEGSSITKVFRSAADVTIAKNIKILSPGSFAHCETVSSLIFESDSQLSSIESHAFYLCS